MKALRPTNQFNPYQPLHHKHGLKWGPPTPTPCPVMRAWIGTCGEVDRSKCKHFNYLDEHPKCRGCGRPALGECDNAGSFVCGAPVCSTTGNCRAHNGSCRHVGESS